MRQQWTVAIPYRCPASIDDTRDANELPTATADGLAARHMHQEAAMSDLDDFLNETLARQVEAEEAIHKATGHHALRCGNAGP